MSYPSEYYMDLAASTVVIDGKTYRNLVAQIDKNKADISALDLESLATIPGRMTDAEDDIDALDRRLTQDESDARTAIAGKEDKFKILTVELPYNAWVNNAVTVTVTGVTTSNIVDVAPDPDNFVSWGEAGVYASSQALNQLTFKCGEPPVANLTAIVRIWR